VHLLRSLGQRTLGAAEDELGTAGDGGAAGMAVAVRRSGMAGAAAEHCASEAVEHRI
jgi:hypothetical protein